MSDDPVSDLNKLRRGDKMIRKAIASEIHAAGYLAAAIENLGEEGLREKIEADVFDELMAIHRRLKELGEEQYKQVRFRECKAAAFMLPDQN